MAEGKMYLFGGIFSGAIAGSDLPKDYAQVGVHFVEVPEVYDPSEDSWSVLPAMSVEREALAATLGKDGKIYVIGGANREKESLDTVEVFDPKTGTWETLPPLPTPRRNLATVTGRDGKIYALGGENVTADGKLNVLDVVEVYDPVTKKWDH